ncbi:MAG TPA: NAD-dependent epimerase/dehydratase family protein [Actinophytocola sp.]|uniref:NAD-dependent epimerase/dehydratase family protein n=1 Tax=Actinophytocola sp. TaxID=1872138 RepID=UPI002DDCB453|nr:NAD-dependent epimerase/dehydratase family protein [Actinophytocola sp.]HEV2779478.1 NAD-dependent epimerase/dehydratase family protein [Actinophytocola sp.]
MTPNVVLVTGVGGYLGGNVAARLAANPDIERVIGVDTVPPRGGTGRAAFVRADIRNPLIAKVINSARVDTVVHAAPRRAQHKELTVIGTMQLLAACQRSRAVRKLVVRSTAAVYGASSRSPAAFTEDDAPRDLPASGYARDAAEVEGYVRGFARRRPDVVTTTIRFADLIGADVDSVITRYFALPVVPTVLGFDARVQLLHGDDALAVLERATLRDLPGVYNAGADGVLMLSQAIRRAGRVPLPVPRPAVPVLAKLFPGTRAADFSPDLVRYLNFGRVVDTGRLKTIFGFAPRWTTARAFDDYVRGGGLRVEGS